MMIVTTPGQKNFADAPLLGACPYFREVISSFDTEIRGVRLLRLTPGSKLKEHTDHENTEDDGVLRCVVVDACWGPQVSWEGLRMVGRAQFIGPRARLRHRGR